MPDIICSYCLEEIEDSEPASYLLYGDIEDGLFVSIKDDDNEPIKYYYHSNYYIHNIYFSQFFPIPAFFLISHYHS